MAPPAPHAGGSHAGPARHADAEIGRHESAGRRVAPDAPTLGEQRARGLMHVEPSAIGAGFVEWCLKQGWLVRLGGEYFASKEGVRELDARFGIVAERTGRR